MPESEETLQLAQNFLDFVVDPYRKATREEGLEELFDTSPVGTDEIVRNYHRLCGFCWDFFEKDFRGDSIDFSTVWYCAYVIHLLVEKNWGGEATNSRPRGSD